MTPQEVSDRLLEMGQTLRRLHVKGCFPAGYVSAWPDIIRAPDELFGAVRLRIGELEAQYKAQGIMVSQARLTREAYDGDRPKADPPPANDISRMDEALGWFIVLTHRLPKVQYGMRRAIWWRALGMRTGKIANRLGVNRDTVRVWWDLGCEIIAGHAENNFLQIRQLTHKFSAA